MSIVSRIVVIVDAIASVVNVPVHLVCIGSIMSGFTGVMMFGCLRS